MRRAASRVSSVAADRRPRLAFEINIRERLCIGVTHHECSGAYQKLYGTSVAVQVLLE
jgi:hypothetical protein